MNPPVIQSPMRERPWDPLGGEWDRNVLGLFLPPRPTKAQLYDRPVAVDLFCRAGGMGLGFHQAGYHVAAAMDFDESSALTYLHNLGERGVRIHFDTEDSRARLTRAIDREWGVTKKGKGLIKAGVVAGGGWIAHHTCGSNDHGHDGVGFDGEPNEYLAEVNARPTHAAGCRHFFFGDVRNFTGAQILDALGLDRGEVDVVTGGPPCQGFSMAGRRNVHDPRNSLVFEFARLVVEILPQAMVFENVPGIVSMVTPDGKSVIDEFATYLETGGMGSTASIREALEGRPQSRIVRRERNVGRRGSAPDDLDDEAADSLEQLAMAL